MKMILHAILWLFCLLVVANRVSTQSCYSCVTCGNDSFSTVGATVVNCSSNLCFTTKANATLLGVTNTTITRGCAANGTAVGCFSGGSRVGSNVSDSAVTCTCSGDKCNSEAPSRMPNQSCYSCDNCGEEPFSTIGATVVNCSSSLCFTTKANATLLGVTTTTISRGCAVNGTATGCVSKGSRVSANASSSAVTCTCTGDKCNSGATFGMSNRSCYTCENCGEEPFSTVGATVVNCSSNLCFTTKASATVLGVTATSISRGCAANGTATGCVSGGSGVGGIVGGSAMTCTCSGDKCNSAAVSEVSTQSCYSCIDCGDDPFSTAGATVQSCSSNFCYTVKANLTIFGVTNTSIYRGCADDANVTGCVSGGIAIGNFSISTVTCTCSGDKCNSGATSGTSTPNATSSTLPSVTQNAAQSCYWCSNCGDDPFATSGASTVSCSSNLCYKTKASATASGITTTIISRGCAAAGTSTGCASGSAGQGSLVSGSGTTCTCSGEKCNTGTANVASIIAFVISWAVVLILH